MLEELSLMCSRISTLLVNPLFPIPYYPTKLVTITLPMFFMNWMVRPLDVQHSGLKVLLVHQVPMLQHGDVGVLVLVKPRLLFVNL